MLYQSRISDEWESEKNWFEARPTQNAISYWSDLSFKVYEITEKGKSL